MQNDAPQLNQPTPAPQPIPQPAPFGPPPTGPSFTPPASPDKPSKGKKKILIPIIIGIAVLIIGFGGGIGYAYWQGQHSPSKKTVAGSPTKSDTSHKADTPAPTVDETANWKTYTDTSIASKTFSFKYPATWGVKTTSTSADTPFVTVTIQSPDKKLAVIYFSGVVDGLGGTSGDSTTTVLSAKQIELTQASPTYAISQFTYKVHSNDDNSDGYYIRTYVDLKPLQLTAQPSDIAADFVDYPGGGNNVLAFGIARGDITNATEAAPDVESSDNQSMQATLSSDNYQTALKILQSFTAK